LVGSLMTFETLESEDKQYFDVHLKGLAETVRFIDEHVKAQLTPFISQNPWISCETVTGTVYGAVSA
jgi:hypothetical protein